MYGLGTGPESFPYLYLGVDYIGNMFFKKPNCKDLWHFCVCVPLISLWIQAGWLLTFRSVCFLLSSCLLLSLVTEWILCTYKTGCRIFAFCVKSVIYVLLIKILNFNKYCVMSPLLCWEFWNSVWSRIVCVFFKAYLLPIEVCILMSAGCGVAIKNK